MDGYTKAVSDSLNDRAHYALPVDLPPAFWDVTQWPTDSARGTEEGDVEDVDGEDLECR